LSQIAVTVVTRVTDDKKQTSIEQHVTEVSTDDQGPIYKES